MPAATAAELARLQPQRIVIAGSTTVVSAAVETALRAYGTVRRLAGPDRFVTAVELSRYTSGADEPTTLYVATGLNFPDGRAVGPVAGLQSAPLLLVGSALPPPVAEEIRRLNPSRVVVLGGSATVPDSVVAAIRALFATSNLRAWRPSKA